MGSPEPQITECPISDVAPSDWFYTPVLWAYEIGISTSSTFNPGNLCSNAEVLTFLWRAEGKPAAAVHSSPVALAASGAYYERPAAWAETNGMLDSSFDPSVPCSRANLMIYLQWITEEWTFAEENKALQAEYEQIINDAQLYEAHGSGLAYADYVDVEGDGTVELLTVGFDKNAYTASVTVYTNIDGHAGKLCEGTVESLFWQDIELSTCKANGKLYLHNHGKVFLETWGENIEGAEEHQFFKIEDGDFALADGLSIGINGVQSEVFDQIAQKTISANEYNAVLQKYTDEKGPFVHCFIGQDQPDKINILDRGLLPNPTAELQKIYAAVKNGDFSAFAGTYNPPAEWIAYSTITMDRNGVLTGADVFTSQKPISISIDEDGVISCVIKSENGDAWVSGGQPYAEDYTIYPAGVEFEYADSQTEPMETDQTTGLGEYEEHSTAEYMENPFLQR